MARDFNNLRTVIIDNLDLLQDALQLNPNAQEMAKLALQSSLRGSDLTSQLLSFSRRQSLEVKAIDLDDLVLGTIALIRRTPGEQIDLEIHPAYGLWPASADTTQVESDLNTRHIHHRHPNPDADTPTISMAN